MIIISASIMGLLAICLYCTTLFMNQKSGSKAAFASSSAACQKATSWNSGHRFNISSPMALPLWGSYRPGIYFGMKTRTPLAISTGILWTGSRKNSLRHDTSQDELTQFEWVRHNGINYGNQNLIDKSYDMAISTTFLVKEVNPSEFLNSEISPSAYSDGIKTTEESSWVQRISVKSIEQNSRRKILQKSLYFYIGFEGTDENDFQKSTFLTDLDILGTSIVPITATTNSDENFSEEDNSESELLQTVTIVGKSEFSGYFRLLLSLKGDREKTKLATDGNKNFEISYHGLNSGDVSSNVDSLKETFKMAQYVGNDEEHSLFLRNGSLKNNIEENSNFLVIQVKSDFDFVLDAVFYENILVANSDELRNLASQEMENYVTEIQKKTTKLLNSSNDEKEDLKKSAVTISKNRIVDSEKIDKWIEYYSNEFDQKFTKLYNLPSKITKEKEQEFSIFDIEAAKRALSSLLGGIGYFYGSPR